MAHSLLTDFLGTACSICGKPKQSQRSFCRACYFKLPAQMQQDLYKRFGAGYERAFAAAGEWLRANPTTKPAELPNVKFPASSDELKAAGYEYDNDATCRGCLAPVEWWITPLGKKMPMSVKKADNVLFDSSEKREPHFATCEARDTFRKKR